MLRSKFIALLISVVMAVGLFAVPFAEAGTLAVNQVAMATTPNHDLTATTTDVTALVPDTGQRSTDAVEVNTLTKNQMIGGIAMATFASASYLLSVAMLEKRSYTSHIFV